MQRPKAVVLLSGGLDSATCVAVAKSQGFEIYALSFRYGQRHAVELEFAKRIASNFSVHEHKVVDIDIAAFGGSALTSDIQVPKGGEDIGAGIPITYVPARNTIFLSFALGYAETVLAHDIFIGINAVDYSGYPDCRPEYIDAFQKMAKLATKSGVEGNPVRIHTPLIDSSKADIVRLSAKLGVDFGMTISCYDPDAGGVSCGECDACRLRKRGFGEAGIIDPTPYAVK